MLRTEETFPEDLLSNSQTDAELDLTEEGDLSDSGPDVNIEAPRRPNTFDKMLMRTISTPDLSEEFMRKHDRHRDNIHDHRKALIDAGKSAEAVYRGTFIFSKYAAQITWRLPLAPKVTERARDTSDIDKEPQPSYKSLHKRCRSYG